MNLSLSPHSEAVDLQMSHPKHNEVSFFSYFSLSLPLIIFYLLLPLSPRLLLSQDRCSHFCLIHDQRGKQEQRAHKRRQAQSKKRRAREMVHQSLTLIPPAPTAGYCRTPSSSHSSPSWASLILTPPPLPLSLLNRVNWDIIPPALDPAGGGNLSHARAARKRMQVASFVAILRALLPIFSQRLSPSSSLSSPSSPTALSASPPVRVVEFGAGSGNLVLSLAHFFPSFSFVAVEMKPGHVTRLNARAVAGGVADRVRGWEGMIERYDAPFDVAVCLHACGGATDAGMMQAAKCNALYLTAPCCIGKLKFTLDGVRPHFPCRCLIRISRGVSRQDSLIMTSQSQGMRIMRIRACPQYVSVAPLHRPRIIVQVSYPRSRWLRECLTVDQYAAISKIADSADGGEEVEQLAR